MLEPPSTQELRTDRETSNPAARHSSASPFDGQCAGPCCGGRLQKDPHTNKPPKGAEEQRAHLTQLPVRVKGALTTQTLPGWLGGGTVGGLSTGGVVGRLQGWLVLPPPAHQTQDWAQSFSGQATLNVPVDKHSTLRHFPGEVVSDLPGLLVPWLGSEVQPPAYAIPASAYLLQSTPMLLPPANQSQDWLRSLLDQASLNVPLRYTPRCFPGQLAPALWKYQATCQGCSCPGWGLKSSHLQMQLWPQPT